MKSGVLSALLLRLAASLSCAAAASLPFLDFHDGLKSRQNPMKSGLLSASLLCAFAASLLRFAW
ncbi:MAG: hypothetical protein NTX28_11235 [Novosphingobium sp.]|nr:hypothetical protein [Novosphingobium sp.]